MKSFINSSGYCSNKVFTGGYNNEASIKRKAILETKNTEDIYEIKGKKYYINKNMSIFDIPNNLQFGDAVLFERGGLWRIGFDEKFQVPEGVVFGAYGIGDKPKFYGSTNNFADNSLWNKNGNIWEITLKNGNAGIMVFNEEHALGVKKWTLEEVTQNYDFYHNPETEVLYFYYDGDLEKDFYSIEIGQRGDTLRLNSNSIADNLCIKYTGSHGIVIGSKTENFAVTNCEVGFIGGSHQFGTTRFGNGIEMQLGVKNATIKNNWVYQIYDAGITFQSWASAKIESIYHNIDMSDNLVEFCYYGFEFFTTNEIESGIRSEYKNITFDSNIFRFSCYGWSYEQRPDHWMGSHIRSGQRAYQPNSENFNITNNVFDCSRANIVFWWWHDVERDFIHNEPQPGLTVSGNSYYQAAMPDKRCMTFFEVDPVFAEDLDGLTKAAYHFDSKPSKIVWVEKL